MSTRVDSHRCEGHAALAHVGAVVATRGAETARQTLARAQRLVVVTKFRFMGDTIVATPFLEQLRYHYPSAHISLLTSPTAVTALRGCAFVDELIPLQLRKGKRWQHTLELLHRLRQGNYEAAFLLNRSLHCAAVCAWARIGVRIGYINEYRRLLLTVPIPYFFDRNEVDCHLDMLRALGLPAFDALPTLCFSEAERHQAWETLTARGVRPGQGPLIGIQPGSNDAPIREWGATRYARVADALVDETGGQVVLMGGKGEEETAQAMADAMRHPAVNLVGTLPLREALTAIGQCDLWLGNDTGLLHAAVAQRVASVGLFGPNKVVRWGYETPRHRSLVAFPERPASDDAEVRRCLDAISEDQVLEAAREVLRKPLPVSEMLQTAMTPQETLPPYFAARLEPNLLVPARRR